MNRELIINVTESEITIAQTEDKVLVELNKEQCKSGFAVGDIYLGKVRKIMPGLNAAFVNIGHEKDAFIHYLDLGAQFPSLDKLVSSIQPGKRGQRVESMKLEEPIDKEGKIGSYLQVGQSVMVQIAKEAISTKGPRLTADISLAGRNVVLVPFSSKVFLIPCISMICVSPYCFLRNSFFAYPIPCSPETRPPSSSALSYIRSKQSASVLSQALSSSSSRQI
jgi:ribonuclease G